MTTGREGVGRPVSDSPVAAAAVDRDAQILEERIRVVEQIKRLYAVIMGFAATLCITNIFVCIKITQNDPSITFTMVTYGFCYTSLMTLFYLGMERHLDTKYCRVDSAVPTRTQIVLDLLCLMVPSIWFIVLAYSVVAPSITGFDVKYDPVLSRQLVDELGEVQRSLFVRNLLWLYVIDVVTLVVQLMLISKSVKEESALERCKRVHWIWVAINMVSIVLVVALINVPDLGDVLGMSVAAIILLAIHGARFLIDLRFTFDFYYPTQALSGSAANGEAPA